MLKGIRLIFKTTLIWQIYYRYLDVGGTGSAGDAAVWNKTPLCKALEEDPTRIHFPPDKPLPGDSMDNPFPHYFVGDDAFAATEHLIKPLGRRALLREERLFNQRVSRARRVTENAFGLMAQR